MIDKEKVTLGNRCNAHTLQITENEGEKSLHFVVSGEQNIQGTSGVILNVSLMVSPQMTPGYYTIQFNNVVEHCPMELKKN